MFRLLRVLPRKKIIAMLLGGLFVLGIGGITWAKIASENITASEIRTHVMATQTHFNQFLAAYEALNQKIQDYSSQGVDTSTVVSRKSEIKPLAIQSDYGGAIKKIAELDALLESLLAQKKEHDRLAAEAELQKGELKGKITEGTTPLGAATVSLLDGKTVMQKATSSNDGMYSLRHTAGKYSVTVARSGYNTVTKTNVELKAQQTTTLDVALTKYTPPPPPPPPPATTSSTAHSTYTKTTINTSRGAFTVDMITVNVGSGKARMITDTASDNDCSDNCPTKSLQSYISLNGGFAGINGTYFCPADYAECAGKINTFYWKIYNTRLGKIINENNGSGEEDPVFVYTTSGQMKFFRHWYDFIASGLSISAGINSKPVLVNGGQNILNQGELDSKQKTVKSNRGALGLKGETFYAVVARSATVIDLAEIMVSLGVDSAMNIDGGGSSALYYNGSYKVGPGRSLPNAVIFKE